MLAGAYCPNTLDAADAALLPAELRLQGTVCSWHLLGAGLFCGYYDEVVMLDAECGSGADNQDAGILIPAECGPWRCGAALSDLPVVHVDYVHLDDSCLLVGVLEYPTLLLLFLNWSGSAFCCISIISRLCCDSCSGCCVSNSPNGVVPTEHGPSGGQLTVAPISTEGISPCSVDGDALPTHHHSSDDAGGGDCNSPNKADLDSQSTPGLPVPPRPVPTNPELPSLAPSISHVEFGGAILRLLCGLFHLSGVLSLILLGHAAGLFLMRALLFLCCKEQPLRVHAALDVRCCLVLDAVSFLLLIEEECNEELLSCFLLPLLAAEGQADRCSEVECCCVMMMPLLILVLDATYAAGSAPVLLSGYAAAILCICSLIVLRFDAPMP
ncbi:hypothetical protein Nepgr_015798 [Nepenthes gracilis]|uniref:Uncharacterized protein n=1 Tax=Nepenthes gracilis TaxID=150966 RepID=A0AAD3SMP1_NEPGR|nr:hypothetical protein Nepgr_015798 [Nepenthes gracilis]